jgi:hypothetical protein
VADSVATVHSTTTNRYPSHVMSQRSRVPPGTVGIVREVHVMPSRDVAHASEDPTAAKISPFQAIDRVGPVGMVRAVHVIPSGEVAQAPPDQDPTAQKREPFHATAL